MSVCHLSPIWNPYVLEEEEIVVPASDWCKGGRYKWHQPLVLLKFHPQLATSLPPVTVRLTLASQKLPMPRHGAFVLNGISEGFRVEFTYKDFVLIPAQQNLQGAINHPEVVEDYLQTELNIGRLMCSFRPSLAPSIHISRFGVIPKNHQKSKWRLIVDLSFPSGQSVNDGIPKELCSLKYITIDDAISYIVRMGQGTHLA